MENKIISLSKYMSLTYIFTLLAIVLTFCISYLSIAFGLTALLFSSVYFLVGFVILLLLMPFIIKPINSTRYLALLSAFIVGFGIIISHLLIGLAFIDLLMCVGISVGIFVLMSVVGYYIKYDLNNYYQYLIYALIALIVVSIFIPIFGITGIISIVLTYVGILLFMVFIVFDTQSTKRDYYKVVDKETLRFYIIKNVTEFYMDLINIIIRIIGLNKD